MKHHKHHAVLSGALLACLHLGAAQACDDCAEADNSNNASNHPAPRRLGLVVIEGSTPTSLPTRIPTTLESVSAEQLARQINATDAEDALKYLPSLVVRKRYIGDYNHAVLSTRASGTGNSARSLVFADGVPLSNLLGNGAAFTPRWGMVTPEEIARVDVMYGPFSAAYTGNAVGAVVDYQTRMPTRFEAHARLGYSRQDNDLYGPSRSFAAKQASASIGSRSGDWSWWINANRLDSHGQPQTFATKLLSSGTVSDAGTPVSGAVAGLNRSKQDWWLIGSGTEYQTVQDHLKFKLAYDIAPGLRASYLLGLWGNTADGGSRSWLQDAEGQTVDNTAGGGISHLVNIDGKRYTLTAADFTQTREDLQHVMQALSLKQRGRPDLNWELTLSDYDYRRDRARAYAPTSAAAPQAGRLTDQAGTGWQTLSAKGSWVLAGGEHLLDFGVAQEQYQLRNRVDNLADWRWGQFGSAAATPASRFEGDTRLQALFAQDAWNFAPDWTAVLGLRAEQWRASNGLTQNGSSRLAHAARSERDVSPKAALSWSLDDAWVFKASTGRAIRYPTVSELFQGGFNSQGQAINNDPDLKPERSWTSELSAEWSTGPDRLRATLFHEDSRDALYSQLNPSTNANTVQNIAHIRTRGLELAGNAAPLKTLGLQASLTYADSTILANSGYAVTPGDTIGKQQPRVPRWRANLVASWQASEALALTWAARYSGRQYSTLDNSDPNGFAYQGASKYFTTDLRAQWRIAPQWTLAAGIDNLNNYQYWNFHPYPQRTYHAELRFDL
jgi:iron complex outermembrane receptor protein